MRRLGVAARFSLRDLFAREGRLAQDFDYVSSPLRRARDSMIGLRKALGLPPEDHRVDARLAEISFGEWEGLPMRTSWPATAASSRCARRTNGRSCPQAAKLCPARATSWRLALADVERDTVVSAHGGTGRALLAVLGVVKSEEAAHHPIDQGVVYLVTGNELTRYA